MRVSFSRELWIEQDDFAEVPPPKFFRLKPGGEVRLEYAYIIKCDEVIKDHTGKVIELRCTADLDSKTGGAAVRIPGWLWRRIRPAAVGRRGENEHSLGGKTRAGKTCNLQFTDPMSNGLLRFRRVTHCPQFPQCRSIRIQT
jgi:hypothetical protein